MVADVALPVEPAANFREQVYLHSQRYEVGLQGCRSRVLIIGAFLPSI